MKLRKTILFRESSCDICGAPGRVAGWNVEVQLNSRRTKTARTELCAACANCLVAVLNKFNEKMGS